MTILVRCSDPRINKFLRDPKTVSKFGIGDDNYALIANTGSIKYFLATNSMVSFYSQLEILVPHFKADKIVLLNHTDCGFYKSLNENKEEIYLRDLKQVKSELFKKFPDMQIDGYLINTENGELKTDSGESAGLSAPKV